MKLLSYFINFIAIFTICIIAYLIYPFATDYHEYNELYNCVFRRVGIGIIGVPMIS